jgi:hypothetical protein
VGVSLLQYLGQGIGPRGGKREHANVAEVSRRDRGLRALRAVGAFSLRRPLAVDAGLVALRVAAERIALRLANEACGVSNAATRKYLTADHLWYYPPVDAFVRLAAYVNRRGNPEGRPYFSLDGNCPINASHWERMRAKFHCEVGITNVWREAQVGGQERIQGMRNGMRYKFRSLHGSQKPLRFIELAVCASTDEGDVVWEPFGGLCPGAVVCYHFRRKYFGAEVVPEFYAAAVERLANASRLTPGEQRDTIALQVYYDHD